MTNDDTFPWRAMMAVGFGRLGLASHDFWAMTPREFAAALRPYGTGGGTAPDRAALARMMALFPDERG